VVVAALAACGGPKPVNGPSTAVLEPEPISGKPQEGSGEEPVAPAPPENVKREPLDKAAIRLARDGKYARAMRGDTPVPNCYRFRVTFTLNGAG